MHEVRASMLEATTFESAQAMNQWFRLNPDRVVVHITDGQGGWIVIHRQLYYSER
ncbi:MAG: hypothetical protein K6T83_03730 [Alicyclobacillus sp.]|nr:hypothetical protein [Alicyclobacillus sp.]